MDLGKWIQEKIEGARETAREIDRQEALGIHVNREPRDWRDLMSDWKYDGDEEFEKLHEPVKIHKGPLYPIRDGPDEFKYDIIMVKADESKPILPLTTIPPVGQKQIREKSKKCEKSKKSENPVQENKENKMRMN